MRLYRVQNISPDGEVIEEVEVAASSPEEAAASIVPGALYRGNSGHRATLRAKVYAPAAHGVTTLIRFYERPEGDKGPSSA